MALNSKDSSSPSIIKNAKEILANRPGFSQKSLPVKGGPKYFGSCNSLEESNNVLSRLKKYEELLKAKKVRKLSNLGEAEWIKELGLAKIVKQGKYMQTMGHHQEDFFALFPEEALFLLDIGDIELTLHGVPLALQDAFALAFNNPNMPNYCSQSEYQVYTYLVKQGYIVQRCSIEREDMASSAVEESKKRKTNRNSDGKNVKHSRSKSPGECNGLNNKRINFQCDEQLKFRGWWSGMNSLCCIDSESSVTPSTSASLSSQFPNLARKDDFYLPKPSEQLLPKNTKLDDCTIAQIWYQRINRSQIDVKEELKYSHSKRINFAGIARQSRNWTEYRKELELQRKEKCRMYETLLKEMYSGSASPLLHPSHSFTNNKILDTLKIFNPPSKPIPAPQKYFFKFNVFKSNSTLNNSFKKTKPGIPFARIVVTDIENDIPDFEVVSGLNSMSNGVPVKFAVVDSGQVSFYSFDNANVKTLSL